MRAVSALAALSVLGLTAVALAPAQLPFLSSSPSPHFATTNSTPVHLQLAVMSRCPDAQLCETVFDRVLEQRTDVQGDKVLVGELVDVELVFIARSNSAAYTTRPGGHEVSDSVHLTNDDVQRLNRPKKEEQLFENGENEGSATLGCLRGTLPVYTAPRGVAAAPAPLEARADLPSFTIDDAPPTGAGVPNIRYFVNQEDNLPWVHLSNQGDAYYQGTESYTFDSNGSYQVTHLNGTWLQIYAAKKADRGYFDIFYAGQHIGAGDAHGTCTGDYCPSEVVFSTAEIKPVAGYSTISITNRPYDDRLSKTPVLAVDKVVLGLPSQ
ncbi:hypothetical protein JCM10207_009258 [Rhodosporidiobolus poonsookiae]